MKVLVEKIAKHGRGFVSDKVWYNYKRDGQQTQMPANIKEGNSIILDEYEEDGKSYIFTKYSLDGAASQDKKYQGSGSAGGWKEGPEKQKSIVIQSCMKAAAEAAGNLDDVKTTENYLNLVKKMIQLHDTVVKKAGGLDFSKLTKEPKPKPKPQPKIENEELEVDVEAEDSSDPYDLD